MKLCRHKAKVTTLNQTWSEAAILRVLFPGRISYKGWANSVNFTQLLHLGLILNSGLGRDNRLPPQGPVFKSQHDHFLSNFIILVFFRKKVYYFCIKVGPSSIHHPSVRLCAYMLVYHVSCKCTTSLAVGHSSFKLCRCLGHMMLRVMYVILCDLVKIKGQKCIFLVSPSPYPMQKHRTHGVSNISSD